MKSINVKLPEDLTYIKLHIFSDWHVGDAHCRIDKIKGLIEDVKNDKHSFVICNGDLMNNATKTSVSDGYAEKLSPMEQLEVLTEFLTPIKDKILMLNQGNHEARTYRTDGIDLTGILAKELGIFGKYAREGGVLFLRFGTNIKGRRVCYSIYSTHGTGGGRKEGAKAIRLADLASIVDTDIYIHSHTHLPMIIKENFFRIDYPNSFVTEVEKLFINTASKLSYGGYGQTYEFKPSSIADPIIYLSGEKKHYTAEL